MPSSKDNMYCLICKDNNYDAILIKFYNIKDKKQMILCDYCFKSQKSIHAVSSSNVQKFPKINKQESESHCLSEKTSDVPESTDNKTSNVLESTDNKISNVLESTDNEETEFDNKTSDTTETIIDLIKDQIFSVTDATVDKISSIANTITENLSTITNSVTGHLPSFEPEVVSTET